MIPVSPENNDRLGLLERARLGAEILAAYGRVRWLLRFRTPAEAVERLRTYARRHQIGSDDGADLVVGWRLAHAVGVTLSPLPTDAPCLFRSLTLLTLMERRSIRSKLVIGIRPAPFAAHAWIELHGKPLLPSADPDHERFAEI